MLRSEAITIIKRGLGFRQTQDAAIIAALKQAQRDLEMGKTLPSWMMATASVVVPAGEIEAALPARFLRFPDDLGVYYYPEPTTTFATYLPRANLDDIARVEWETDSSPRVYLMRSPELIEIRPVQTEPRTIYFRFYQGAEILDSDIENAWLKYAPNYLIGLAGAFVAGDLRDRGALDKFSMMAKSGAQAYFGDVVDDELMGRPLRMGRNN